MTIFSLIDCNNFYASCERVFQPQLENKPIVVLSNNDGCVIARSNESKLLDIPMGAPFFQYRKMMEDHGVHIFSSNYELYGDMSSRVMATIQSLCPDIEIYSIDEIFLQLDAFKSRNLIEFGLAIKKRVNQWTRIPVSVGIGATKTLAKIANHLAKKQSKIGVVALLEPAELELALKQFPVEKIWGIGRQLAPKLMQLGIHTAYDLSQADPKSMRKRFSVVTEKMIYELRGKSCLPLESVQPNKQIMSSRSFGQPVTTLEEVEQAITYHVTKAAEKCRRQRLFASGIDVFVHTNPYDPRRKQYANRIAYPFAEPSADTGDINQLAQRCLREIFRPGFHYHKAGIMLLDLFPQGMKQGDLFAAGTLETDARSERLMATLDQINHKMGRGTVRLATEGFEHKWALRSQFCSPRYTTRLEEVPKVLAK